MAPEVIDSETDCAEVCGVACDRNLANKLVCPPICTNDNDCEAGRLCTSSSTGVWRCLGSDCANDSDCFDGTCVYEAHVGAGVHRCSPAGDVAAGGVCGINHGACKKGLTCSEGMCLPTKCVTSSDCPTGSDCTPMAGPEKVSQCIPACTTDADCGTGRTCHVVGESRTACTAKFEAECLTVGCGHGETCHVLHRSPDLIAAECMKTCSDDTGCGDGSTCVEMSKSRGQSSYGCLPACKDSAECKAGRVCRWVPSVPLDSKVCSFEVAP